MNSLKVLLTNITMSSYTGTEWYVYDLAIELLQRGHEPVVFTPCPGPLSEKLEKKGIAICGDLSTLTFQPDIIHAHHVHELFSAILHYPDVPVLFICHDATSPFTCPPLLDHVDQYLGVDIACQERLTHEAGIPAHQVKRVGNFVNLRRFTPRKPLPEKPDKALLLSNYADETNYLSTVEEACQRAGLSLDVRGAGVGSIAKEPEKILGSYDLVFAKAKAAMEAMAVGTAVILCDFRGIGSMVTCRNFEQYRENNFGARLLNHPFSPEILLRQINAYNAEDAMKVSLLARDSLSLVYIADTLVSTYRQLIRKKRERPSPFTACLHIADLTGKITQELLLQRNKERKALISHIERQRDQLQKNQLFIKKLQMSHKAKEHHILQLMKQRPPLSARLVEGVKNLPGIKGTLHLLNKHQRE